MFLYNNAKFLIRKHILEQYEGRIINAKICYDNRSCIFCGCKTPSLFFANKACGLSKLELKYLKNFNKTRACYINMLSKTEWNNYKNNYARTFKK